jgi:hypothetical protein
MAEKDWFRDIVANDKRSARKAPSMARAFGDYQAPSISNARAAATYQAPTPSSTRAMNVPGTGSGSEIGSSSLASNRANSTAARERVSGARSARQTELFPQTQLDDPNAGPSGSGGGGGSGLDKVFAPLFAALDQQRANANSRYTENSGQITNIYGQLIGARTDDVDSINTAYERLQAAAASRGAERMSGMAGRESDRVSGNQAVLGSMGIGDLGTAGNDVASAGAQAAQNTEAANQSNWAGQLDMMNATSQDIARADATSFGYRQGEDIARLQGSREDFLQGVDQQDFNLQSQQIQAEQEYQQAQQRAALAAIAAQQKAEQDAQKQAGKDQQAQFEMGLDYLKNAAPLDRSIGEETSYIGADIDSTNVTLAYNKWLQDTVPEMGYGGSANAATSLAAIESGGYANQLSPTELRVLKRAVLYTFDK